MIDLEYAKRGLIGVLTPQANTTVEPELVILLPTGITMLNARLTSEKDIMEDRLVDYTEQVEVSLDQFSNAPLQAVAFACTGASYLVGRETEKELCDRIETARGYPFITAARAVTDSLNVLEANKIGLVSPYPPSLTDASIKYWETSGFEVTEVVTAFNDQSEFHPIYSLRSDSSAGALLSLENKNLDVIVMLGTGMPTLRPILDCASWRGAPVTSCMLSLAWRTVLHLDRVQPSASNLVPWTKGECWRERINSHFS